MVRRRLALTKKVRAVSAEGRASAAILVSLPVVSGVAVLFQNPQHFQPFFTSVRGPAFLLALGALVSAGLLTIHWLIQRSTRD